MKNTNHLQLLPLCISAIALVGITFVDARQSLSFGLSASLQNRHNHIQIRQSPSSKTRLSLSSFLEGHAHASNYFLTIRGGEIDSSDEYDSDSDSDEYDEEYDEDTDSSDDDDTSDTDSDTDTDTSDSDTSDDDTSDEYDSESETEPEVEEAKDASLSRSVKRKSSSSSRDVEVEYDEPIALTPMQDMGITLGVMVLCNRLDLTNTKVIKYARFAFIAYVITAQIFLLYVRYRAYSINDTTPITITNPLASLIQNQLPDAAGANGTGDMVKNLANQFLGSASTIVEYDLSQTKSMNNGLLIPMLMLWVLHFKMGQVQPLFFQTASGVKELIFSPLFQTYILGKNLERPFKNKRFEEMQKQQEALAGNNEAEDLAAAQGDSGDAVEESEDNTDDESDEDSSDDESDSDDDSSDDDEEEYDDEYDDEYD